MPFNILRNATIRNDMSCRHDNRRGYAVVWDEDSNFKQYTDVSNLIARVVWDKVYFAVSTDSSCSIGPESAQVPFDGGTYDLIKVVMRLEPSVIIPPPTTGKIEFQTTSDPFYDSERSVEFPILVDNAYNEYVINMSLITEWVGDITKIKLFPFIDGTPGVKIHLKSIAIESSNAFACDTSYNTPTCNKFSQYSHPCPWVGRGASSEGIFVSDGINIEENINDELVVNINGFGDQRIKLTPVYGARLLDVARDIEEKLSNIGIGGYSGVRVDVNLGKLKIIADDTREASSTIIIRDTPAARELGFYSATGEEIAVTLDGEEAASRYEPAGTIQLSKAELSHLYLSDPLVNQSFIHFDSRSFSVQAGRPDFSLVYHDKKVDFTGKTIIDFNNPINSNGLISYVAYSGDGNTSTEFRFFRPQADGTIVHHASLPMGILSDGQVDKVFEASGSIRVRKGDLVGLYNGKLHLGKFEELPNTSYYIYDGSLAGEDSVPVPFIEGKGERGLRLFARGSDKATEAVVSIEFPRDEAIEQIQVIAEEESQIEEINLSRVLSGGLNGGPHIEGSTGLDKFGFQAPPMADLGALTDGEKLNTVGVDAAHPSWADGTIEPADLYSQTEFNFVMDFAKATPVFFNIGKVILYFRDENNIKFFGLEFPLAADDLDINRVFIPVTDKYNAVFLEGKLLAPDTHPLYQNPIRPTATEFLDSYQLLKYRTLEFNFDPVRARSIKYVAKNYYPESDVFKSTFSLFDIAPSPYILEMEVFATSTPTSSVADNFSFESSSDGENYVVHNNVTVEGETSASYLIGYPVKYLRVHIKPQGRMDLKSFFATLSQGHLKARSNELDTVNLNISLEDFSSSSVVEITNDSNTTYDYYIDIAAQRNLTNRCLLWNNMSSEEDLKSSFLGPSPAVKKRDDFIIREYNYSLNVPAYMVDPYWMLNKNMKSYISYDTGDTWEPRGNTLSDYNEDTYLTSENPNTGHLFTFVLLDLGDTYGIDEISLVKKVGEPNPAFFTLSYSNKQVDDPADLDLFNDFSGVKTDARWIRLTGFSRLPTALDLPNMISYIRITLDPTLKKNHNKIPWIPAPKLTNYIFGTSVDPCGEGWHCPIAGFTHYYAVDLEYPYNISNIVLGPSDSLGVITDWDTQVQGFNGSAYGDTTKTNSTIAYSNTQTSDPKKVRWGSFSAEPPEPTRWIILKRDNGIRDEVLVHIEDNVQKNKPLFSNPRWWSSKYGSVFKEESITHESTGAISTIYPANTGPNLEELEIKQSFGIDHQLAKRDFLRVLLYIEDKNELDLSKGYIAIGRNTTEDNGGNNPLAEAVADSENYYQWDFEELGSDIFTTGWNELLLPFSDNFRVGEPFFTLDNPNNLPPGALSGRSRLRWFKVAFAGKSLNRAFQIVIDEVKIVRGKFLASKFSDGLYLAGSDYAKFPLSNFNTLKGSIEFWLNPDWSKTLGCMNCLDARDHTIFRIFNNDGYVISLLMTGLGLRVYLSDGSKSFFLTDNSAEPLVVGEDSHVAVSWDLKGEFGNQGLSVYINNKLSAVFYTEFLKTGDFRPNSEATLIFGAQAWDGLVTASATGVEGVVGNIKLFNYPVYDFSSSIINPDLQHARPSDDLIEISMDNIEFFGNEKRRLGLPILIRDVAPNETFKVYVRRKELSSNFLDTGQDRNSFIHIMKTAS